MNRPTNDVFLPLSWSSLSAETSRLHMLTHVPDPTMLPTAHPGAARAPAQRARCQSTARRHVRSGLTVGFLRGGLGDAGLWPPWHRAVRLRERRSQRA